MIHKLFTHNVYLISKLDCETQYTNSIDDVDFQPAKMNKISTARF